MVQLARGLYDQSRESFHGVLQLHGLHREAKLFLNKLEQALPGMNHEARADVEQFLQKAIEHLPRHIEMFPEFSDIIDVFSSNQYRGLFVSLINFYENIAQSNPSFADIHDNLGSLQAKLENYDQGP